jgi:predicted ATPase
MTISAKPYLQRIFLKEGDEIDRGAYPFSIPAVANLEKIAFHPDVTFFVGENGAGKSTVLEAIALALGYSPEGGTRNVRLETTDSVSKLHKYIGLTKSYRSLQMVIFCGLRHSLIWRPTWTRQAIWVVMVVFRCTSGRMARHF